jgi:aspartate kinase
LPEVGPIVEAVVGKIKGTEGVTPRVQVTTGYCKVSAVGAGMRSHPGVASTMFKTLADQSVKIENITTSEIGISCILSEIDGPRALRAVHEAFGLASAEAELKWEGTKAGKDKGIKPRG